MPRELNTDTMPINQPPPVNLDDDREPEIIRVERVVSKEYVDALAFNEEPVTIRVEPGMEENASPFTDVIQVNGRGAEILLNDRWHVWGHLPIDRIITTKRKYLEVMIRSKSTRVHSNAQAIDETNQLKRSTSGTMAITIIEDRNPRGHAWIRAIREANF